MRISKIIVIAICSLFYWACSSNAETKVGLINQFTGILPKIIQNDEGLLHGISLGMDTVLFKQFIPKCDSMSVLEENKYFFEGALSANKEYSYECEFDSLGLSGITLDVHLKDMNNADSLFTDFSNYFSRRYGTPVYLDDLNIIWLLQSEKRASKIILENEVDYDYGKIKIRFLDKDFDLNSDSLIIL